MSAGCFWGLAGCAAVKTVGADGSHNISFHPFSAPLAARPADGPRLINVLAFGISSAASGFDVGLRSEEIVVAPASCHAIFIVRSDAQAGTAGELARHVEKNCILQR